MADRNSNFHSSRNTSGDGGTHQGSGAAPKAQIKAVFTIIEDKNLEKPLWRRIWTGFVNQDGSMNVSLDALPTNGKLHIRDPPAGRAHRAEVRRS